MTTINSFEAFNSRLGEFIRVFQEQPPHVFSAMGGYGSTPNPSREGNNSASDERVLPSWEVPAIGHVEEDFNPLALALFTLQFAHVEPYRRWCEARGITPDKITLWSDIPPVPAAALRSSTFQASPP